MWEPFATEHGDAYYFNADTGETVWELPPGAQLRSNRPIASSASSASLTFGAGLSARDALASLNLPLPETNRPVSEPDHASASWRSDVPTDKQKRSETAVQAPVAVPETPLPSDGADKSGFMTMPGFSKWKPYFVVLRGSDMSWYKSETDRSPVKSIRLDVPACIIEKETKIKNMANVLHLCVGGKHFNFGCSSPDDFELWLSLLVAARDGKSSVPSLSSASSAPEPEYSAPRPIPVRAATNPPPVGSFGSPPAAPSSLPTGLGGGFGGGSGTSPRLAPPIVRRPAPKISPALDSGTEATGLFASPVAPVRTLPAGRGLPSKNIAATRRGPGAARFAPPVARRAPVSQEAPETSSDSHHRVRQRSMSASDMQEALAQITPATEEPLPPGWFEHSDDSGNIYFWNEETDESSWIRPVPTKRGPRPPTGPAPPATSRASPFSAPERLPPSPAASMLGNDRARAIFTGTGGGAGTQFTNAVRGGTGAGSMLRTGHASITVPKAVTHVANFNAADFSWAYEGDGEKRGWLEKAGGMGSKRVFCIMRKAQLLEYAAETDRSPAYSIPLKGLKIEKDPKIKRAHTFHLYDDKRHYSFTCPDESEYSQWTAACKIGGAIDAELAVRSVTSVNRPAGGLGGLPRPSQTQVESGGARVVAASSPVSDESPGRALTKAQQDVHNFRRRQREVSAMAKSVDPATCDVYFACVSHQVVNGKAGKPEYVLYEMEVQYALASWTILRRWSQVEAVDRVMRREVSSYPRSGALREVKGSGKRFDLEHLDARMIDLDEFMQVLKEHRQGIFASRIAASHFVRLVCPIQMGDKKPPGLVLPFKIETFG